MTRGTLATRAESSVGQPSQRDASIARSEQKYNIDGQHAARVAPNSPLPGRGQSTLDQHQVVEQALESPNLAPLSNWIQYVHTPSVPDLNPSLKGTTHDTLSGALPGSSPAPMLEAVKPGSWDVALATFFQDAGFTQTLRGFESDMLILSEGWEKGRVRGAVQKLFLSLANVTTSSVNWTPDKDAESSPHITRSNEPENSLEARKLGYAHFAGGVEPRTPSTITRSISRFLAQNRGRNDASNRQEFLLSLAEKRRKLNENGDYAGSTLSPSCARTDAKTQNRDIQMKFDVARNEDGPLRKTMNPKSGNEVKVESGASTLPKQNPINIAEGRGREVSATAERHPGLDERLKNVEDHLAIRYVPSPPRSLLDRLKFLEDHIIQLEREYPPWAALHFKQPRRGWPPPPRPTPIIVPSHLTSPSDLRPDTAAPAHSFGPSETINTDSGTSVSAKAKGKQAIRNTKSSLHRAVMERLEVQKAMNDLAGKPDQ